VPQIAGSIRSADRAVARYRCRGAGDLLLRLDKIGGEEGERDAHIDLPDAAFLADTELCESGDTAPIRHDSSLRWRQLGFLFGDQNISCKNRRYRRPEDKSVGPRQPPSFRGTPRRGRERSVPPLLRQLNSRHAKTQVVNFIQTSAGIARSIEPAMRCEIADKRNHCEAVRNHDDAIECLSQRDDVS
jgi:hypothetical protein